MRVRLGLVALTATVLALPAQTAAADGGAYIQFDRTHYLVGSGAHGVAFVAIPEPRQYLLERGPFFVYLVPSHHSVQEGRLLPEGTIRLATATIEHDFRTTFRISTSFTVPDVPGDYYTIQFCNEPCTISGFRESLTGQMSIVQTLREATLLNEQQRLFGKNWHLRRQVRKADREMAELQASIGALEADRDALIEETASLKNDLERARRRDPATDSRPLAEGWALVTLGIAIVVALSSIALALAFTRRRGPQRRFVVPDTIAELDDEREDALTRT
jgi:hypothetical protein